MCNGIAGDAGPPSPVKSPTSLALIVSMVALLAAPAFAADSGSLYVGAAVANARYAFHVPELAWPSGILTGTDLRYSGTNTTTEAILGIRPLSWLGLEASYANWGTYHFADTSPASIASHDTTAKAKALNGFAIGFLPLTRADLFAKVGFLRAQTRFHEEVLAPPIFCAKPPSSCPASVKPLDESRTTTVLSYGGGIQLHVERLIVRAEYETSQLDRRSDVTSLGLLWTFF